MPLGVPNVLRNRLTRRSAHENRLVSRDGRCNVAYGSVRHGRLLAHVLDLWSTLMETRWRYVTLLCGASFVLGWFVFGLLWYWVARVNGDMAWQDPPPDHVFCVINILDMTGAFLTSVEAQMSIGYGYRLITPHCPGAIVVLTAQAVFGTVVICFWCGAIMVKVARPKKRGKAISFGRSAVVGPRDGRLCLQVRVANMRKSLMLGGRVHGKLLRTAAAAPGGTVVVDQTGVDFTVDAGSDELFFACPLTLCHVIDEASPFLALSRETPRRRDFELVVFLDGTAESTSSACQVRTSYLPAEIMWGYRFLPVVSRTKEGRYRVNFSNFAKVVPVETPPRAECDGSPGDLHQTGDCESLGGEESALGRSGSTHM